jgi:hypothetical protein
MIKLIANEHKERFSFREDYLNPVDKNTVDLPSGMLVKETESWMKGGEFVDGKWVPSDWEKRPFQSFVVEPFAPARYLDEIPDDFVLNINGQNYMVIVNVREDSYDRIPNGLVLYFCPTDEPETEFVSWDDSKARQESIDFLKQKNVSMQECIDLNLAVAPSGLQWFADNGYEVDPDEPLDEGDREAYIKDIEDNEYSIKNLELGEKIRAPFNFQVFGHPSFIQSSIYPMYKGQMAQCLMVIENDWGDCGNINVMFACDLHGVPAAVWMEASCC